MSPIAALRLPALLALLICSAAAASAEVLLRQDFTSPAGVDKQWTLSPDSGEAKLTREGARLVTPGYPAIRSNDASNFNDDGTRPVTYSVTYDMSEAGAPHLFFWVRMDEAGIPAGHVLLPGGSRLVQGYAVVLVHSGGQNVFHVVRYNSGEIGQPLLTSMTPPAGIVFDGKGTLSVRVENTPASVVLRISQNGELISTVTDTDPQRLTSGVGVGVCAFDNGAPAPATLTLHRIEVTR